MPVPPACFAFDAVWRLPEPADVVFAALADVDAYPVWWPQVRAVERAAEDRGVAHVRSLLPVGLRLEMTRLVEDVRSGRLRVGIEGDLVGFAEFTVRDEGGSASRAVYRQEVAVGSRPLQVGARVAPFALRANHEHMMRAGERGLRRHLARPAQASPDT